MVFLPTLRIAAQQPSPADLASFAARWTDAPLCDYPGSVDDVPPRWFVNRRERSVGRGRDEYARAAEVLETLECLELGWLTHRVHADALAICSRQFGIVWMMNANRILRRKRSSQRCGHSYSVTWGTTQRHVLCGEERLTVRWDAVTDEVRFEVLSFSRPRHLFSWIAYPYVIAQQRRFARDATEVVAARAAAA